MSPARSVLAFILLTATLLPVPARADVDCSFVEQLMRLNNSRDMLHDLGRRQTGPLPLGATGLDMRQIDAGRVNARLRGAVSNDDRRVLGELADLSQQISRVADRGDVRALRALMSASSTERIFSHSRQILGRIACPTEALGSGGLLSASGDGPPSGGDARITDALARLDALTIRQQLAALVIISGVVAVSLIATFYLRGWHARRKRLDRRVRINVMVDYVHDGTALRGRLVDISARGTKLEHDGAIGEGENLEVTLLMNQMAHPSRIMWANEHFVGLKFDEPLSPGAMQTFLRAAGKPEASAA